MAHQLIPEAEEILDKEFPVLDSGFVRLVDYLGGDQRIVQAARVSYGAGTKSYRQDKGLINYLLRNEHTSPFEQVILTFHTKMPIFVARQWVRHRTARLNEISGRYSVMEQEFYLPAPEQIALQSSDNKQGRSSEPMSSEDAATVREELARGYAEAYRVYQGLLDRGVARELARVVLPLSLYTEWYWQIDLHNLFHFLKLRVDPHAQYEIRAYGEVMLAITRRVAPLAVEAFEEHIRGGVGYSATEHEALRAALLPGDGATATGERSVPGIEGIRAAAVEAGLEGKALERFLRKVETGLSS
ncbi:MAG: FAD-dependent thymidylate synthase [Spirochaetaceae bacterium]